MRVKSLVAIGIRILGILLIALLIKQAPQMWMYFSQLNANELGELSRSVKIYSYILLVASIFCAILMIKFPMLLSSLIMPRNIEDEVSFPKDSSQTLLVAGLVLIGVYILTWSIPDLVFNSTYLWYFYENYSEQTTQITGYWLNLFVTLVEILIGAICVLGTKGILKAISYLRG